MWYQQSNKFWTMLGISCLLFASFFIIPTITSLYYYAWSGHLAWSYFDGPPMIAYFFYLSRFIFGHSFFAINVVGFCCFAVGIYYIYRLGLLLDGRSIGLLSALIWVILPLTTENVLVRAVYDAPLNLFTVMTFYYFSRYLKQKKETDLFLTSLCISGMVLSKFTAIVSLLGLFIYILFSKSRNLLISKNFYIACILMSCLLFPLFYWNAQHHWVTVFYLLNFHSIAENHTSTLKSFIELTGELCANFSVFLFISILGWLKNRSLVTNKANVVLSFLYITFFVSMGFWYVVIAFGGAPRAVYLTPLGINIAVTAAYTIHRYNYYKFFNVIYPVFALIAIIVVVVNSYPFGNYLRKGVTYHLVENVVKEPALINNKEPIVTDSYTSAAILSFFMPKIPIYTLPCAEGNQYQLWSESFLKAIDSKRVNKIMYIDMEDTVQCAKKYFKTCQLNATYSYNKMLPLLNKPTKSAHIYIHTCSS